MLGPERSLQGAHRANATPSKLDPLKAWIEDQLRADPGIPSKRLRELAEELGYRGGKTIFDDYVREVRPRYLVRRTYQRTLYRPGELLQFDLFEPREPIPVGHGQTRRGWLVTAELGWSRALAGALVFSKQAPDLLWGYSRMPAEKDVGEPAARELHARFHEAAGGNRCQEPQPPTALAPPSTPRGLVHNRRQFVRVGSAEITVGVSFRSWVVPPASERAVGERRSGARSVAAPGRDAGRGHELAVAMHA
jgi:hypothetical protein